MGGPPTCSLLWTQELTTLFLLLGHFLGTHEKFGRFFFRKLILATSYLGGRIPCGAADLEQDFQPFFNWNSTIPTSIVDYKDLYVMSSVPTRVNIQILNFNDNCCFYGNVFMNYDNEVTAIAKYGGVRF